MFKTVEETIYLGDGRTIILETGKLARQADGSVLLRMGKTMILATVVSAREVKDNVDFMPLSVDYVEKFASVGRFPGGFMRRESKPNDNEILTARLIDRALRPLFPSDYHADTFVTVHLISADKDVMADALAGLAASAALSISDVPFNGPISEVRVSRINGEFKVNPLRSENADADIDIMVGGTADSILMIEGEMNEVSETEMLEAIKIAHTAIKIQCQAQLDLVAKMGGVTKREYCHEVNDEDLKKLVHEKCYDKIYATAKANLPKGERSNAFGAIKKEFIEANVPAEEVEAKKPMIGRYYHDVEKDAVRNLVLNEGIRLDGRRPEQIRQISCEVDFLPATHGSALFTRGETQSLTTVTLGSRLDEKIIDEVLTQGRDKFLLHYNFPPFSTGEAKPVRGIGRREIGHGNLAHRALKRMIPTGEDNPYTIRVVSDILESNGSSSMATVCAGTLALMDSGIQLKKHVSGIAMGLITDLASGKFVVLSDILGDEDHLGDMDFKVTGTSDGLTACQMDIKIAGLSYEILFSALEQAKGGRMHIHQLLIDAIPEPRPDYKPHAPRIEKITVPKEMIGAIIGPGGKIIQEIQAETGAQISIEEVGNKGIVFISAENKKSIDAAIMHIRGIIELPEIGKVYRGRVKSIVPFGAFVEILPSKDGLLHISEIEWRRLESVEEVLHEGDMIDVKLIDIDKKTGKLKLSRKAILPRNTFVSK